jgi:hypothetical protein
VLAAGQVQHHQVARGGCLLRERQLGEELRRGKPDRERRDAAFDELSSCEFHGLGPLSG